MKDNNQFTVVVADDEEELREAVCQMIDWPSIGFRLVGSAGNGLDALQLVEQLQPDLLLTDIHMPFISGLELAKQVRELRPLTQIVFLSGYDEFEYAQQAIAYNVVRYLLKPITMADLTQALTDVHSKIEAHYRAFVSPASNACELDRLLMPLLLDGFSDDQGAGGEEDFLAEAAHRGFLDSPGQPVQLTVLATECSDDQGNRTQTEMTRSVDMILEKYYRTYSFFSGGRILTLLLERDSFSSLHIVLEELIQAVRRVLHLHCSIGVSRPFHAFSDCHSACREAVDALQFAEPYHSGIHNIADIFTAASPATSGSQDLSQIESLLRSGSQAELEKALAELFSGAGSCADLAALQVIAAVLRMMQAAGSGDKLAVLRSRMPDPLSGKLPPRELLHAVCRYCMTARTLIADQRKEGVSLMCSQALEQINLHYMDELLSLGAVSENLHVSPTYLSANMKKYAGDTFMNLLIKKRMEIAGTLLATTNLKIMEVAQRCGYSDQHYFSYCFKKYYGDSPATLRRRGIGEKGADRS